MADAADPGTLLAGGLGSLLGSGISLASTQAGVGAVGDMTNQGAAMVAPYNYTGANYLGPVGSDLLNTDTPASQNIGNARINSTTPAATAPGGAPSNYMQTTSADPVNFENFAQNYNTSEGAQYLMRTAAAAQDSTAASRGGLLSGANLRAQNMQQMDLANQDLIGQYTAMRAGQQQGWQQNLTSQGQMFSQEQQNYDDQLRAFQATQAAQQQDFQQRETSYQNMYGQEAMGLQAGVAEAGTYAQGARAIGSLYGTQATNAQNSSSGFGSALGGIFSGLAGIFKAAPAAAAVLALTVLFSPLVQLLLNS